MKKLNLVYPDQSEIKYKVSKFPDGQNNITIEKEIRLTRYNSRSNTDNLVSLDTIGGNIKAVIIKSRLNNWLDLELIVASVAALRELGVKELQKIKGYKNSFLVVTHGIFSAGFEELSQYFNGIYCTNSYKDITKEWERDGNGIAYFNNVKQLNIFYSKI